MAMITSVPIPLPVVGATGGSIPTIPDVNDLQNVLRALLKAQLDSQQIAAMQEGGFVPQNETLSFLIGG
jgi:hypothetical protein